MWENAFKKELETLYKEASKASTAKKVDWKGFFQCARDALTSDEALIAAAAYIAGKKITERSHEEKKRQAAKNWEKSKRDIAAGRYLESIKSAKQ